MTRITLTTLEVMIGALVGAARHTEAIRRGCADAHGFDGQDGLAKHVLGATGELAFAKHLNVYWTPTINAGRVADVGDYHVRTRSLHTYDLIVRSTDPDDGLYALVTGEPPDLRVRGWTTGSEAKQDKWIAAHGNRPAAWFVPAHALKTTWEHHGNGQLVLL